MIPTAPTTTNFDRGRDVQGQIAVAPGQPDAKLFDRIRARHGHYCPMSTLGGRLGFAARSHLAPQEVRSGRYYLDTCALDGIVVATGCDAIEVVDRGRHALWLVDACGRGVLVELRPAILARAAEYRTLDLAIERERAGLTAAELAVRLAEKAALLEQVLQQLRSLPDEEVLTVATELPEELGPT